MFARGRFVEDLPQDLFREGLLRLAGTEAGDPLFRAYEPYALRLDPERRERQTGAHRLVVLLQGVRRELDADLY